MDLIEGTNPFNSYSVSDKQSMASANSAILERILSSIQTIQSDISTLRTDVSTLRTDVTTLRTDVTTLRTDVSTLRTDVITLRTDVTTLRTDMTVVKKELGDLKHQFHSYIKRESDIQELVEVNKFLKAWESEYITLAFISPFRDFFRASDNSLLTDLDGCMLIGQPAHAAYIIESKHAFAVDELLKKLE